MKYYGINHRKKCQRALYQLVRIKHYILQHISTTENARDFYKFTYDEYFCNKREPLDYNYSIPEGKFCKPTCLVTSDLVLRDDIPQLKKGLVNLIRKHHTHKYWVGMRSFEEVTRDIEQMDAILSRSYSTVSIGRFDFERDKNLSSIISHFDLFVKQINASYLAIEIHVYFAEEFLSILQAIIDSNIDQKSTHIGYAFMRNKKKSGGMQKLTVGSLSVTTQKSDPIFEHVTMAKWSLFNALQRYFPTVIHRLNAPPPGILFYETNIDRSDTSAENFWYSLGICGFDGQFIDEAQKLFFTAYQQGLHSKHIQSDMIYVYHSDKIPLMSGRTHLSTQIIHEFTWKHSSSLFKFGFLQILNDIFSKRLIPYKYKVNKIKLQKNQLHGLLKLRYCFEKDMDIYKRYLTDNDWDKEEERVADFFTIKKHRFSRSYKSLTRKAINLKSRIQKQIEDTSREFEDKGTVLQHLYAYKTETKNRILNYTMLFIAALTLLLVIFPEWSKDISEFLANCYAQIISGIGYTKNWLFHRFFP